MKLTTSARVSRVLRAAFLTFALSSVSVPALADFNSAAALYSAGEHALAFREFLRLAENGDVDGQQAVGVLYEHGRGVDRDEARAAHWYRQAAERGHAIAAGNLGVLYRDGRGVPQDLAQAAAWLMQGAMGDDGFAKHNLGALYANGQGVSQDLVEGWAWVSLAVEDGNQGARADLTAITNALSAEAMSHAQARAAALRQRIADGATDSGYQGSALRQGTGTAVSQPTARGPGGALTVPDASGWTSWQEGGIGLRHPAGWAVRGNGQGAAGVAGPRGESLIVWPIFTDQPISDALAVRILEGMTRKLEPQGSLQPAHSIAPRAARAGGTWGGREFAASLVWVSTTLGDAATYILASAPVGGLDGVAPTFAAILDSVTLRSDAPQTAPPAASARGAAVAYTTFTDPSERAFTVAVPAGWQVGGGLARFNASDVRPWLRAVSPDRQTLIFMGDPELPSMLVPNPPLASMGFTEGMIYDAGFNQRFLLRSYHPGKEAARLHAQTKMSANCGRSEIVQFRDRPEPAAAINAIYRKYGSPFAQQMLHTGEIALSCPGTGRAQYVFAGTLLSQFPSAQGVFQMWIQQYLYGFETSASHAATALDIVRKVADSFRVDPDWLRRNVGLQGDVARIVAETGAAIATSVSEGYWNAQHTGDVSMSRYGEAVLGVEETTDPLTGRRIEVVSGANHYWVDPRGRVVGTQTNAAPSVDHRELVRSAL